jgi:hypothetical protein
LAAVFVLTLAKEKYDIRGRNLEGKNAEFVPYTAQRL